MKIKFIIPLLLLSSILFAQKSDILLSIDNRDITKEEFVRIYNKNNSNNNKENAKSVDEYLELFINFKLKVIEAENKGLDTAKAFVNELKGYRKQLSKPYLTDNSVDDRLIKEAFERRKQRVRASHILIMADANASPRDTLIAYNKCIKIIKRIEAGEDFNKVAIATSEDPSVKNNSGDLGYFSAFQMVYPFESAVYNLDINKISKPIRTKFGYHVLKVTDKQSNPGEVKVAHIMLATPPTISNEDAESKKTKISEIYNKLKAGDDFAKLAREFSDDKGSGKKGGELPFFGTGRMVPTFENAAFNLKADGDFSEPIKTKFGWHIIKRIAVKPLANFDDSKEELKAKLSKDARASQSRIAVLQRLKGEYKLTINKKSLKAFNNVVDETIFEGKWDIEKASKLQNELFILDGKTYSQQEFANYLAKNRKPRTKLDINTFVNREFNLFIDNFIIKYEEDILPVKYSDFKYLLQEYHDGILLFDLTDKMVWSKAVKDTSGLKEYYAKNKTSYMWGDRVNVSIYTVPTEFDEKARKIALKRSKKNSSKEEVLELLKALDKENKAVFTVSDKLFSKEDNETVDKTNWKAGITESVAKGKDSEFIVINKTVKPESKKLKECKGLVTADYQNLLEKLWIKELKEKYKVKINDKVLNQLKEENK